MKFRLTDRICWLDFLARLGAKQQGKTLEGRPLERKAKRHLALSQDAYFIPGPAHL